MAEVSYSTACIRRGGASVKVHLHQSRRPVASAIIINLPGYNGTVAGYNDKYVTLAKDLAERNFAVVRMPNTTRNPMSRYCAELLEDVRAVIKHTVERAGFIAGNESADIYLMGFSMGGFAIAAVAAEFPRVKKLLMMEPASLGSELTGELPAEALGRFEGEAYIVMAESGVGEADGRKYYNAFARASRRELLVIPDCDHQFTGRKNGQIMAKAPLWAFAADTTFPSPDGGLVLYD